MILTERLAASESCAGRRVSRGNDTTQCVFSGSGLEIANLPLVPQIPIPESLFSLDPQRVIGLTVEPDQLLQYRVRRQKQLGALGSSAYVNPQAAFEEVQEALNVFYRGGFKIVDMTD